MIRIAAITLASDSAITLARFRPSKVQKGRAGKISVPGQLSIGVSAGCHKRGPVA